MTRGTIAYIHGDDEYGLDRATIALASRLSDDPTEAPLKRHADGTLVDRSLEEQTLHHALTRYPCQDGAFEPFG